jgi:hypothetical protein
MECLTIIKEYVCKPPFMDEGIKLNYDPSIEVFRGILYAVFFSSLFWVGIFFLIRWLF